MNDLREIYSLSTFQKSHNNRKKTQKDFDLYPTGLTQFKKQEPKFMFIHFPIDIQSHILRIPRCFRIPQFRWIPGSPKFNMMTAIIPKRTFFFHTVDGSEILQTHQLRNR